MEPKRWWEFFFFFTFLRNDSKVYSKIKKVKLAGKNL